MCCCGQKKGNGQCQPWPCLLSEKQDPYKFISDWFAEAPLALREAEKVSTWFSDSKYRDTNEEGPGNGCWVSQLVVTITGIYGTPTVCARYLLEALHTSPHPHNSSAREALCSQTGKSMLREMNNETTPVTVTTTPTIPASARHTPCPGRGVCHFTFTLSLILATFPQGNLRTLVQ